MSKLVKRSLFSLFFLLTLSTFLTSCLYEMPAEDDIHTVPNTNNPNVIRDVGPSMPTTIDY